MKKRIRDVKDYPKQGIVFKDITPLLSDRDALASAVDLLSEKLPGGADVIAGIEARGFILGSALAYKMKLGFVPIRKKGKLPYKTESVDYDLEYGSSSIEAHEDAFENADNVVIVDDLLATGGTASAAQQLVEKLGGNVSATEFLVELQGLGGRDRLKGNVISIIKY